jgi:hypothetical protein
VQIGRLTKRHRRAGRVRRRADLLAGVGRRAGDVRADAGDVVAAEQRLDSVAVRQGLRGTRYAVLRRGNHLTAARAVSLALDRLRDLPERLRLALLEPHAATAAAATDRHARNVAEQVSQEARPSGEQLLHHALLEQTRLVAALL